MNDGNRKEQISVEIIISCLEVIDGAVHWKKDRPKEQFNSERGYKIWKKKHSGKIFGSLKYSCGNVYRHGTITVKDKTIKILAHNAAFVLYTGRYPDNNKVLDHADGCGENNKQDNLREVTKTENNRNSKKYKTNSSGVSGVHWHEKQQRWHVQGGSIYLGSFLTLEEAIQCRSNWIKNQPSYTNRHGT